MENLKIKIDCTREHLEKAKWCDLDYNKQFKTKTICTGQNCWIAVAVSEVLKARGVEAEYIYGGYDDTLWEIKLPSFATDAINAFDSCSSVQQRMALPPFSFEIEIDPETLDKILKENGFDLKELETIIEKSDNLERV